jgi:hypothetical protein
MGFNESVEISVGESLAQTLFPMPDDDVAERAGSNVTVECLNGATELFGGLGGRLEPVRALASLVRCGLAQLAPSVDG